MGDEAGGRARTTDTGPASLLDRWVGQGFITAEQAARIRAAESLPADSQRPTPTSTPTSTPGDGAGTSVEVAPKVAGTVPLVTEALGYVGGALILVAAGLIAARFWHALTVPARLGLLAGAAIVLVLAGLAIPQRLGGTGYRLRSVLWLASVAALAVCLVLAGIDALHLRDDTVALFSAGGSAAYAAVLWWRLRAPLQHLAFFVPMVATAAAAAVQLEDQRPPGLTVWGASVVWLLLAWGGLVPPQRVGYVAGGVGALIGAGMASGEGWGTVLGVATSAVLVVAAVLLRDLVLLAIGAVGALETLPSVVQRWFPGALSAPLVLLAVGLVLVAVAVYTTRRRREEPATASAGGLVSTAPAGVAIGSAIAVAIAVLAFVLLLGLT